MASDWVPGTKLRTVIINLTTDADEKLNHVGIGYDVVLPSGRVARSSGWTWHGEADEHDGDADLVKQLQVAVDQIRADLAGYEGVATSSADESASEGS